MKRTKKIVKRRTAPKGRFFVVNHRAPNDGNRTILDSEAKAVEYAKELIADNFNRGKQQTTLYVVQLMKVIKSGHPPVTVRLPTDVKLSDWRD